MLQRYLILWLAGSSLVAFFWPALAPTTIDPFDADVNRTVMRWLIVVTMFAIGWMLPRDEVHQVARRWPVVLAGTILQYTSMPLLAYLCGRMWGLQGDHLIGIVMVGAVPGAMASNVLTLLARGNASYSVSLTTLATLLSPVAVPLALWVVLGARVASDVEWFLRLSRDLLLTVVLPVAAGHVLGRRNPQWEHHARSVGPAIAALAILWIIAATVGQNRENLRQVPANVLAALVLLNAAGYAVGLAGSTLLRLPEPMRRALTLEIGMQNAGLGAFLATQLFPDRHATAIAPAMYTFGCMLTGSVLARIWARRGGADK